MSDSFTPRPARAWHRLKSLGYGSSIYRLTLGRRAPEQLTVTPEDPWPGDPDLGNAMFQGRFCFAGVEALAPNQPPWRLRLDDLVWSRSLHEFTWLRHFRAVGGPSAASHARKLVRSWIDLCDSWEPVIWDADVVARRVVAWVGHAAFLFDGADEFFQGQLLSSLDRQVRHLGRAAGEANAGRPALAVAMGLVIGGLVLPESAARASRGLVLLARELDRQIAPDGGYASRSPSDAMAVLRELISLRDALVTADWEVPVGLQNAIDRMAPMLRSFRHGDGGLALFNGGYEETADDVAVTLARAEAKGQPLAKAPHSGFQRLSAASSIVIVDTGHKAAAAGFESGYAGALSFEFSVDRQRLVVNCGSGVDRAREWISAMRVTAAHSVLAVDDTNNIALVGARERVAEAPASWAERNDDETGNAWLDVTHEGYAHNFGLHHQRRLYLAASGDDLRGEDSLISVLTDAIERPFRVRFHLHPDVEASLVQSGEQALIRLPSGDGWRFRASGAVVALEDSVYLGRRDEIRRTQQLVVSGAISGPGASVKWAFRKI